MWSLHPAYSPSTAKKIDPAPRCWADGSFRDSDGLKVGIECSAIADAVLGLCKRHAREILGRVEALAST